MSMNTNELDAESAELLPGREALSTLNFTFYRSTNVSKHVAHVAAANNSASISQFSPYAVTQSEAQQSINIAQ